jgi:hypothetical protein
LELPFSKPITPDFYSTYEQMLSNPLDHSVVLKNRDTNVFPNFTDMKQLLMSPLAAQTKASMEPSECLNLLNMNSLGEPDASAISKHDLLSAISFDKRGDYLSVGDRGGRVIIFERKNDQGVEDFDYFTEFQSHTKSFDTLQSSDISEHITGIEWLNNG